MINISIIPYKLKIIEIKPIKEIQVYSYIHHPHINDTA